MTAYRLDPVETSQRIGDNYRAYLESTFRPRNDDRAAEFAFALANDTDVVKGPFLQASAPYQASTSLRDLVTDRTLHPGALRLGIDADRVLYRHQEVAIRKAVTGRNIIVATGTGSGKTEAFLLPILDALLREDEGTLAQPGVRALLLYPMNALVNDQLKRLRQLLAAVPEITFGRYVGDTADERVKAEANFRQLFPNENILPNEQLCRNDMKDRPPHLLVTNYAMLEYLLMRPADTAFFDGPTGDHWRAIVLDEAHVYGGAKGTEVGMLMRRLKDRITRAHQAPMQCFATSATLGGGPKDYPELVGYASALFSETFAWDPDDPGEQDVVDAKRLSLARSQGSVTFNPMIYARLRDIVVEGDAVTEWRAVLSEFHSDVDALVDWSGEPGTVLARVLAHDLRLTRIQEALERGTRSVSELVRDFFDGAPTSALVALVDLAETAHHDDDAPLLPARYHYFARALDGGYVCLHPEHVAGEPALSLARARFCPSCLKHGRRSALFELAVCRRCGAEHLMGDTNVEVGGTFFRSAVDQRDPGVVLIVSELSAPIDEDEDEEPVAGKAAAASTDVAAQSPSILVCPECCAIGDKKTCACAVDPIKTVRSDARSCGACGRRSPKGVVSRMITGSDAPVAVIATDIYQTQPPASDERSRRHLGEGRKLLSFADSRQDAAFFASYLDRTYNRSVQRRMIGQAVRDVFADGEAPTYDDLVQRITRSATDLRFLDDNNSATSRRTEVANWVHTEMLSFERRQTIEGVGFAKLSVRIPHQVVPIEGLIRLGLSEADAMSLLQVLLLTLVDGGVLTNPDDVDITDERFAPRNRPRYMRVAGSSWAAAAFVPATRNKRSDYVERVFARTNIDRDVRKVLRRMWETMTGDETQWRRVLHPTQHREHGAVFQVEHKALSFTPADHHLLPGRCDRCKSIVWHHVAGVCSTMRCPGTVVPVVSMEALRRNHYFGLYERLKPIPLGVEEHTAQWTSTKAAEVQAQFIKGELNVLSCSTTFEMGVDVGDVQAVLLRNVPPTPANYIQRAGRAGRRADGAALAVTFAQRRNHDFHYFRNPARLIDGKIPPPQVQLSNPAIVRRHVHAVALAQFLRHANAVPGDLKVGAFLLDEAASAHLTGFRQWLDSRPVTLHTALAAVVPPPLLESIGVATWKWVAALFDEDREDPTFGWLGRAAEEVRSESETLLTLMGEAKDSNNFSAAMNFDRVRKTLVGQQLIQFLASRNVLPKYGFPVDVVGLNVVQTGATAENEIDLTRDLSLAIVDYAPGHSVVAAKKLWTSKGISIPRDRAPFTFAWAKCECGAFRRGLEQVGATCPVCQGTDTLASGTFLVPVHGFVGAVDPKRKPGDDRPQRNARVIREFGSFKGELPEFKHIPGLRRDSRMRTSRQGRITIINTGPAGRGYRLCKFCGAAEPAPPFPTAVTSAKSRGPQTHQHVRTGRPCKGIMSPIQFGHEYLTDTLELDLPLPTAMAPSLKAATGDSAVALGTPFLSALQALLLASPTLGIEQSDLNGTLSWSTRQGVPTLIIHDSVPGGAGHVFRIAHQFRALIESAVARVRECNCGLDSSCYGCLRDYRNQFDHERLTREDALWLLEYALETPLGVHSDSRVLDLADPSARPLVGELLDDGVPAPEIGYEVHDSAGNYMGQVEASWPDQKVCLVVDVDGLRDAALNDGGWRVAGLADGENLRRWLRSPAYPKTE